MFIYLKSLLVTLCLSLLASVVVCGQEPVSKPTPGVVELSEKLDEQQTQIDQLKEMLQRQSELIEKQQQRVNALQQNLDQAGQAEIAAAPPNSSTSTTKAVTPEAIPIAVTSQPVKTVDTNRKIKFNGLLQAWFVAGNGSFRDTFRVRRAELKLSGEISPKLKWTIMVDPSKALAVNNSYTTINGNRVVSDVTVNQASRVLQDAYLTFDYSKNAHINVGQFKMPLSLEGLQSSAKLDTVERALFISDRSRGGNYGDVRDLGMMVFGSLGSSVDYQLGLFNGGGENQNDVDKNDQKAVGGRLVVRPQLIKGLQTGFSGTWSGDDRGDRPRRNRLGAEALFTRHELTLKAEFMTGADAAIHRRGYYTHLGYRIAPRLETVFRFDTWDPNTGQEADATSVTERDFIVGFNFYLDENRTKLQFNYLRKTFARDIVAPRNVLMFNLQTSW
jgi:hypothetical protein